MTLMSQSSTLSSKNFPGYWYFGLLVSTNSWCVKNLNPPPVWLKSSNSEDKVRVVYAIKCKNVKIIKRIPCVCSCVIECYAFIHWLFLLGLFNVFYDLIAYVLSFDAVISHLGP